MATNGSRHQVLLDAWRLAKPYWFSEDKWPARGLLAAVIALNLTSVYLNVRFNYWRNDFYNTLQNFDEKGFFYQIMIFSGLATAFIVVLVYQIYLQQMLQIRWRRWLTRRYLGDWLESQAYYRMQLHGGATDNPDQRISDDLNRFTNACLSLTVGSAGVLNSVVTLASFLAILWTLSGSFTIPLGSMGAIAIPGYMVWFALIYAIGGTWLTVKVGRPLVSLNFNQQRYEADFRFSLVRLRENTESVALYGGEKREYDNFSGRFGHVVDNFWSIMKRTKLLNWWTSGYGQFAVIFPYLVAAPRYFAKTMELGGLMQTADAFGTVQGALSFIVNAYTDIAEWQSVVQRLDGFETRVREIAIAARAPQQIVVTREGEGLAVEGLDLNLPDGTALLRGIALTAGKGDSLLITGPTGIGKSTLLRAVAGIWPYGKGAIRLGEGRLLFLPQRPYLPLGTLRETLIYPSATDSSDPERVRAVLDEVGLAKFASELDEGENWARRLSLGEQQRLAFARILLAEPSFLFLDEATSALDEESEARLYRHLRAAAWRPTLVSIGHRSTLTSFHDRSIDITPFRASGILLEVAKE